MTTTNKHQSCECGNHVFRKVCGHIVLVSPNQAPLLDQPGWTASGATTGYLSIVRQRRGQNGRRRTETLARVILGIDSGLYADHISGDRLDNRDENLRPATPAQNTYNQRLRRRSVTGLKGVSPARDKYRASIKVDGRRIHLGVFDTAEAAFKVYQGAASELHGEFARSVP